MKKIVLTLLFLFPISYTYSQLKIESCQEKAKANYPLIKEYDLISKSLDYTLSNANKAWLPQLSVTGIGGYLIKGLPSVSLPGSEPADKKDYIFIGIAQINQNIWDGGATKAQKNIAKASAEVDKASTDVAFNSIKERVNQLYFGILVVDEQLNQLKILNENLNRNLNSAKLSKDNGLGYQSDVDEVKSEILSLEQKKIEFNFTRKGYVEMLSYMIGEPLKEDVQLDKPITVENYASLTNNRAELNLYANQIKLTEASSSMDKVSLMPKVGLLGAGIFISPGMSLGTSEVSSLAVAGLSMSWDTHGLYKSSNNRELEKIQKERINTQQDSFLFTNNLQLQQASNEIEKQKAILIKDDEIVLLKEKITKAYQLKKDNGMSPMNDLITAINKESEARSNKALHNVQLLMSLYNYKTIKGN
ncbi:TolC family protein [Flavobacterium sp. 5]|uniref:TolC family protein n=1 Tax=Flavobacterium sp. 5 TaxID=2035199 RepID=UPI000C2BB4FE|nr:TolC family protein [Flavobacterium sp. 5]PKB18442.1 outer membrane protein TolC [Flavobacterium sp. 5]